MTLEQALARYPGAETFRPGDSAAFLALVRAGRTRATCSPAGPAEAWPLRDRRDIALNGDGTPALVLRTAERREVRFCDVTEEMALAAGESDTLAEWQAAHRRRYEQQGVFSPDMRLVWRRLELVEDLEQPVMARLEGVFQLSGRNGTVVSLTDVRGVIMIGDRLVHGGERHPVTGIERIGRRLDSLLETPRPDTAGVLVEGELKAALQSQIGAELTFERGQDVH